MANHNPRAAAGDKRAADTSDSANTTTARPKKLKFIPNDAVGEPLEMDKKSLMKYNTSDPVVGKPTAMPFDSPDISAAQPMNGELDPNTAVDTPVEQKKNRTVFAHLLARGDAREFAARSNDSAELKTAQPRQQQLTPNPAQNTAMNEEVQRLSDKEEKRRLRNRKSELAMEIQSLQGSNAKKAAEMEAKGQQQALPALPQLRYSGHNRPAPWGGLEPLVEGKTRLTGAFAKMSADAKRKELWKALTVAEEPPVGKWTDDSAPLKAFDGALGGTSPAATEAGDSDVASDADSNASADSEHASASDNSASLKASGSSANAQAESRAAVFKYAVVEGSDGLREKLGRPSSSKSSKSSRRAS